ncbi:Clavaminate synthase-like protein [Backusella circina FSU 941]|nr:Clavaminate synthase-like protein [Backusella circina FSU 941]KAI8882365.1 Clavaminate synthase-like protein [Backusella circina FSU 941]
MPIGDHCPLCKQKDTGNTETWLQCDACNKWYHGSCLDLSCQCIDGIERFHCPHCVDQKGPSTYKKQRRKSNRGQVRLNYADLNEGTSAGDERIWSKLLKAKSFQPDRFKRYKAKELIKKDFLSRTGLREPFVVEENERELEMEMPNSDITVHEIADIIGREHPLEVIDVASQSETTGWTLGKWADYFHNKERDRIRNVISLEISQTELGKRITRPRLVRELDWIDQVWPRELSEFPKVQLYCLMGTKDSYTDFHIDFGGSSVFYHILSGSKTFYFIEPTPKNLKKYQTWTSSPDQSVTFFGDLVKECYCVKLKPGNTMIIPTGWIHAVFTPEDAIVIGGNFLHSYNVSTQLKIYEIEDATNVPRKFRFPYYKKLNWYALARFDESDHHDDKYQLESMAALAEWLLASCQQSKRRASSVIPKEIKQPTELAERVLAKARKGLEGSLKRKRSSSSPSSIS